MSPLELVVLATGLLAYALLSRRLAGGFVSMPLVFAAFGFAVGEGGLGLVRTHPDHAGVHLLAELTLAMVLFADAAHLNVRELVREGSVAGRMLLLGLPLAILFGALLAAGLFPEVSWGAAFLLAAILAPTDAALGQPVITDPAVPPDTRQVMVAESGLNDGLALPAVVMAALWASGSASEPHIAGPASSVAGFAALQVGMGPLVGGAVGWGGGLLVERASAAGWMTESFRGIGILALALLAFALAELTGGNGFLAAFSGGVAIGCVAPRHCGRLLEFMEAEGQLLTLFTFFLFGVWLLPEGLAHANLAALLYALGSLSLVRGLAIALSLVGSGLALRTRLFMGWFGPRGLASILFALLILEEYPVPEREAILACVVLTVALSIVLHGVSASPLAGAYGRWARTVGDGAAGARGSPSGPDA